MARKPKRRRFNGSAGKSYKPLDRATEDMLKNRPPVAATDEEKRKWQGWCEIESEPALFNVMLRDFGVKDVKVQEVWSMDDQCLELLPRPIYGLIFLFRWIELETEDDSGENGVDDTCATSSGGIWFATQVAQDSCASVALLNVLNNSGVHLGARLDEFKENTRSMVPAERGEELANFEFVRAIHNSFSRKMDMLVSDLALKREIEEQKKKSKRVDEDGSEPGFHFIAFVPAAGKVWQFDGMDDTPRCLGGHGEKDWLDLARPAIQSRMNAYATSLIEFSLLSVVKGPGTNLVGELAANVKALNEAYATFNLSGGAGESEGVEASPPSHTARDASFLEKLTWAATPDYGLTQEAIEGAVVPEAQLRQMAQCASLEEQLVFLEQLASRQFSIRGGIVEERTSLASEEDLAARRRHDYGPAIFRWLQLLAQKEQLPLLVAEAQGG